MARRNILFLEVKTLRTTGKFSESFPVLVANHVDLFQDKLGHFTLHLLFTLQLLLTLQLFIEVIKDLPIRLIQLIVRLLVPKLSRNICDSP